MIIQAIAHNGIVTCLIPVAFLAFGGLIVCTDCALIWGHLKWRSSYCRPLGRAIRRSVSVALHRLRPVARRAAGAARPAAGHPCPAPRRLSVLGFLVFTFLAVVLLLIALPGYPQPVTTTPQDFDFLQFLNRLAAYLAP
jgi:hypothetical protein